MTSSFILGTTYITLKGGKVKKNNDKFRVFFAIYSVDANFKTNDVKNLNISTKYSISIVKYNNL